jgi:hypothetical protein
MFHGNHDNHLFTAVNSVKLRYIELNEEMSKFV